MAELNDLTEDQFAYFTTGHCIFCDSTDLIEGPHGGMSVNWYCGNGNCRAGYNVMGPLGAQIIQESAWAGEMPVIRVIRSHRGGRLFRWLRHKIRR
jgi:hypothetical protein